MVNGLPEGTVGEVTVESERETVEEEERELAKVWDLEKEKREERVSDWEEVGGGEGAMSTIDAMVLSLSLRERENEKWLDKVLINEQIVVFGLVWAHYIWADSMVYDMVYGKTFQRVGLMSGFIVGASRIHV